MKAAMINMLSNAAWFSSLFLIPLFAQDLGATEEQIGLIVAGYGTASLVSSYIFGRLADIHGRRLFLRFGLIFSAFAALIQILSHDPLTLLFTRALMGFSAGVFPAALMAYAYESKWKMGKFMAYGSLGWGVGTIVAGILATVIVMSNPYAAPFLLSALLLSLSFIISMRMPKVQERMVKVPLFPVKVIKKNMPVYLTILIRHMGACTIWVIFPIFVIEIGGSFFWIGVIYGINSLTQFIVMRKLRAKSTTLIIWGLILSMITFFLFTLCENVWQLLPTQILLGTAWAFLYVGSIKFIMARNEERATATGLLNSVLNISSIGGALIGGVVAGLFGYYATMYLAAAASFVAMLIFLALVNFGKKKRPKPMQLHRANLYAIP
ncbi:MAG: MFS transporter [Thermoplasmata archaeon]|nr:MFS transporter [Thermoplasmata archaeon]